MDFNAQLSFGELSSALSKKVVVEFDGGDMTSDGGLLLLGQADSRVGLCKRLARVLKERRQAGKVTHSLEELVWERVFAVACGYPDANDVDRLRQDPALKLVCGQRPGEVEGLASQPTVSRWENRISRGELLRCAEVLAKCAIAQLPSKTRQVIIEMDSTDDPCHGQQEFEEFNAYYDAHCYLPLLVHVMGEDGRRWQVAAVLRPGRAHGTTGLEGVLSRVIKLVRQRLPTTHILVRADSGFGGDRVLRFLEEQKVDYVIGLAQNRRLQTLSTPVQMDACIKYGRSKGLECVEYGSIEYKARSWPHKRHVAVKAAITKGELNPRYVVTSLGEGTVPASRGAEMVYQLYGARGDEENQIKQFKLDLDSGRTSCHRFLANQFRLLLHSAAMLLMGIVQAALQGTAYAKAQIGTIRQQLLKVGARVVESCRRICVHLSSSFPQQGVWRHLNRRLQVEGA